ncbi:MAG: CDP-alcohol phosphatidyltransferase family protein [Deltaproteobacteria bacterium]|nr:CDP-alcohol phosphatidyltransferase family protein [Deltaproteobacteria bacterium]
MLVWTPITPNQLSVMVAIVVGIGIWLTAHEPMSWAIAGTVTILGATYLDCCDGEIARVKIMSSKFGAWFDTIVDEATSIAYMAALGWHCHLHFGPTYLGDLPFDPWIAGMVVGLVTYSGVMVFVYYNIIVGVGSANSQDYAARFEVVPGSAPNAVRLRPVVEVQKPRDLPRWLRPIVEFLPNIPRRDFIVWMATAYALLHWTHISFATHLVGGIVTFAVTGIAAVRLVLVRRSVRRAGKILEAPGG